MQERAAETRGSNRTRRLAVVGPVVLVMGLAALWVARPWWRSWQASRARAEAVAARRAGDVAGAEEALGRALGYEPEDEVLRRQWVELALRRGDKVAAAKRLGPVVAQGGAAGAVAAVRRGQLLMDAFRVRDAEQSFLRAIELDPARTEARWALVVMYGVQRRGGEQAEQLSHLMREPEQRLEALRLLAAGTPVIPADSLGGARDEGEVIRKCLDVEPENCALRAAMAVFLRNRGAASEGLALVEACETTAAAWRELAACLLELGREDEAGEALDRAESLASEAERAEIGLLRVEWLSRRGELAKAVDASRAAVKARPGWGLGLSSLAQACRAAGAAKDAAEATNGLAKANRLRALAGSIPASPDDVGPIVEAARLCHELGRTEEAEEWGRLAMAVAPDEKSVREMVAEFGWGASQTETGASR